MSKASERQSQHEAILAALNAPEGRARSNQEIATEIGCSVRAVAYVRRANPAREALEQSMRLLDDVFPGIYQWYTQTRATAKEREKEATSESGQRSAGVNSPTFGRMIGLNDNRREEDEDL